MCIVKCCFFVKIIILLLRNRKSSKVECRNYLKLLVGLLRNDKKLSQSYIMKLHLMNPSRSKKSRNAKLLILSFFVNFELYTKSPQNTEEFFLLGYKRKNGNVAKNGNDIVAGSLFKISFTSQKYDNSIKRKKYVCPTIKRSETKIKKIFL